MTSNERGPVGTAVLIVVAVVVIILLLTVGQAILGSFD